MINNIKKYYNKIIFIIGKNRQKNFIVLLCFLFVLAIFEMFGIGLIIPILSMAGDLSIIESNSYLSFFYHFFNFYSQKTFFIFFSIFLITLFVLKIIYSIYVSKKNFKFAYEILEEVSLRLTIAYMRKPYEYFLSNDISKLVKNTTLEVGNFATGVIVYSMSILVDIIMIFFISIFLLYINYSIFFFVIGFIVFLFGMIYLTVFKRVKNLGETRELAQRYTYKTSSDIFNSIKDIKINNKEDDFVNYLRSHIEVYKNTGTTFEILRSIPKYIMDGIIFISIISVVLFILLLDLDIHLLIPTIGVYVLGLLKILPALNRIVSTSMTIKFYLPTVNLIYTELKQNKESIKLTNNKEIVFNDKISISNLKFSYENNSKLSINNMSIKINKNSAIAFVGQSGSGKSTIINILLGLLDNYTGTIDIDGVMISKNIQSYQNLVGYVPQHIFLFNDSVAFNISLEVDKLKVDYDKLDRVLSIVKLTEVIDNLEYGLEEIVGEKGMKLSGGQIQRIGIARALYKNPQILIMDESTSALDNKTEKEIIEAISNMRNQMTIIMVAHRLSTVEFCDNIFVMNKGKVIEQGNMATLIKNKDYFYNHIYKHGQQL